MDPNNTNPPIIIHLACIVVFVPTIYVFSFVYFVIYSYIFYRSSTSINFT